MTVAVATALSPDLVAGLRRLKLARIRQIGAEVCQAAKTQRWVPEELLRTLVEAELRLATSPICAPGSSRPGSQLPKPWISSRSSFPRSPRPPSTTWPRWSGCAPARTCRRAKLNPARSATLSRCSN